jgi:hypothetical protein
MIDSKTFITGILIALFTFLATKHYESIEFFEDAQDKEIESLKNRLYKMDSLHHERGKILGIYKDYFEATIDTVKNHLKKNDSLTVETIKVLEDSTNTVSLDSIVQQLRKHP